MTEGEVHKAPERGGRDGIRGQGQVEHIAGQDEGRRIALAVDQGASASVTATSTGLGVVGSGS